MVVMADRYRILSYLLISLLCIASAAHAKPVKYCDGKGNYAVKVEGVEISPNPVVRGKPAMFSIKAATGDAIATGKLIIDVKYFGVHIHQETHDLCKETTCPVSSGDFILSHDEALPSFTPPGSYTLNMKMLGESGSQLTCISFDFHVALSDSPVAEA